MLLRMGAADVTHIADLPTETLKAELERADLATAVCPKRQRRQWIAYRSALLAEITRREPVSPETAAMSDDDLLRELSK